MVNYKGAPDKFTKNNEVYIIIIYLFIQTDDSEFFLQLQEKQENLYF